MSRVIVAVLATIAVLISGATAFTKEYPTGIASIELGDSKRTVFEKIRKSRHIKLNDYHGCKPHTYKKWLENIEKKVFCDETVKLFDEEFSIEWKFSKRNKLYQIELHTCLNMYSTVNDEQEREKVRELNERTVRVYSSKYGPPSYLNTDAYPYKPYQDRWNYCLSVAKWTFPNGVTTEMDVCGRSRPTRYQTIFFYMTVTDQQELARVEEEKKRKEDVKAKEEERRKAEELKKTKELL